MVRANRTLRGVCRCADAATPSAHGPRHGDTVRQSLDRGSGAVTSFVLIGAVVVLALGGLGGASVIVRVTSAIRDAELLASTVATRSQSGDPTPCEPEVPRIEKCIVDDGIATVRVNLDGVRASAVAGPDR